MICVSLQHKNLEEILDVLDNQPVQMAEIRLDRCHLSIDDIESLFSSSDTPLVATCRVAGDGSGTWSEAEERLLAAIEAGAAFADVEIEAPAPMGKKIRKACSDCGTTMIRSCHFFDRTPDLEELKDTALKCKAFGGEIVKIVTMAFSAEDAALALSLYETDFQGGLIAFAMGAEGKESRVECLRLGAPFSYAALTGEEAAAPGQWDYRAMTNAVYGGRIFIGGKQPLVMPSSKSFAQRAIIAAALAEGESRLGGYSSCGDNEAALAAAGALGASAQVEGSTVVINGIGGRNPRAEGTSGFTGTDSRRMEESLSHSALPLGSINVGESGLLTRLMIPVAAALDSNAVKIEGKGTLLGRPLKGASEMMASFGTVLRPVLSESVLSGPAVSESACQASAVSGTAVSESACPASAVSEPAVDESVLPASAVSEPAVDESVLPASAVSESMRPDGQGGDAETQGISEKKNHARSSGLHVPLIVQGPLLASRTEISGKDGSQLISGLLMALPLLGKDSEVYVREPKSIPYMFITIDVLRRFGITIGSEMEGNEDFMETQDWTFCTGISFKIKGGQKYSAASFDIEGDWSAAANFLVAGAVFGRVRIDGMDTTSLQADISIMDILMEAGASLSQIEEDDHRGMITAQMAPLRSFEADLNNCPDLFPIVAVLAAFCGGKSRFEGFKRLASKESDRGSAILNMLSQMGVRAWADGDALFVEGMSLASRQLNGKLLKGGEYTSSHDHRMAMALSVASLGADSPIVIDDSSCVGKSFPGFFATFKQAL